MSWHAKHHHALSHGILLRLLFLHLQPLICEAFLEHISETNIFLALGRNPFEIIVKIPEFRVPFLKSPLNGTEFWSSGDGYRIELFHYIEIRIGKNIIQIGTIKWKYRVNAQSPKIKSSSRCPRTMAGILIKDCKRNLNQVQVLGVFLRIQCLFLRKNEFASWLE